MEIKVDREGVSMWDDAMDHKISVRMHDKATYMGLFDKIFKKQIEQEEVKKEEKDSYEDEEGEIKCICGILNAIARITFSKGELFNPYEYLYTGQTQGIDSQMKSNITGFITIPDMDFQPIDTPNGKVDFVEFIGVTDSELRAIQDKQITVKELYEKLGSDATNYNRKAVL